MRQLAPGQNRRPMPVAASSRGERHGLFTAVPSMRRTPVRRNALRVGGRTEPAPAFQGSSVHWRAGNGTGQGMADSAARMGFLFDVDNTLLDNDAVQAELSAHLQREFGRASRDRYWAIFEELRAQLVDADYLGALQRYRLENLDDPQLLRVSFFLVDYPFAQRRYAGALAALARCARLGTTVILSDGDVVFQPRKVQRAGLWDAVDGRVLIYLHKEQMLDAVERRFPADHYVMVDDKLRILAAMKRTWRERLTTVFVRQGHYAHDPRELDQHRAADVALGRIGELAEAGSPENQASWLAALTRNSGDALFSGV